MEFQERTADGVQVLIPVGRIDVTCAAELRDRVASIVDGGNRRIVIDMSEVDFIDSSGLGMLVTALRTAKRAGAVLKIAALKENLKHLFEATRLDRLFELFTDVEQAVKSFQVP